MKIKNLRVYGLLESCVRSGYPMQMREPASLDHINVISRDDDTVRAYKLAKNEPGTGHNNTGMFIPNKMTTVKNMATGQMIDVPPVQVLFKKDYAG